VNFEDAIAVDASQGQRLEASSRFERREAQVARILEAARSCFLKSGFQGASMGDICGAAAMSPGALYRYFPSKESLIEAIIAADKEADAKILAAVAKAPSIVDGMTIGLLAHADQVHKSGMAPLFAEIYAEAMRNPAIEAIFKASMCEPTEIIGAALHMAVERGEINPVMPLEHLLPIMMAMGHGIITEDLPRMGISVQAMEPAVRAMIVGLLRPVEHATGNIHVQTNQVQNHPPA
jgi:TetR/AcrR family transcriptional regulator, repressor for uid operon